MIKTVHTYFKFELFIISGSHAVVLNECEMNDDIVTEIVSVYF